MDNLIAKAKEAWGLLTTAFITGLIIMWGAVKTEIIEVSNAVQDGLEQAEQRLGDDR